MINYANKKGSAIITAVGMGIVLLIIIIAIFSFSQYRTQTVIQESKKVKALALAEAGIEVAIAELFNDTTFATHEVIINQPEKSLDWKNPQSWSNSLNANSDHGFSVENSGTGTLSGKLGDGEFKVRVGNIPYEDDERTETINESKAYVKIESMGIYDKTVRRIIAIVNRRFPAREFLMYDGGVLSLIYGQTGDSSNYNVFSTGHLYGHKGIEISRVMNARHNGSSPGTDQRLENITSILSGDGGIFFYSPTKVKFPGSTDWQEIEANAQFPLGSNGYDNATEEEFGQFPESLRNTTPPIPNNYSKWIKDKNSGITIPPRPINLKKYKEQSQFNCNDYEDKYRIHTGWSGDSNQLDVVYLDFGNNIREGNVDVNNFPENGIIYSDKNIVIKGNPPHDVSIVSGKNVFVAGDFNQRGNKTNLKERYGFPQDYPNGGSALKSYNYSDESKELFKQDINASDEEKHHIAATVIANERVVYDYRSPVDCFENELVPYLKYELAKAITTEGNDPIDCLSPDTCQNLTIKATDTFDGFKAYIGTFTSTFNIGEQNSKSEELSESLKTAYESCNGSFGYQELDDLTVEVWKSYVNDFQSGVKGQPSNSGMNKDQGIYKLLNNLRKNMSGQETGSVNINDSPGDYLYYPEMTTNGMFVSCGVQANTFYAGPDVDKYYNEIGYSSLTSGYIVPWSKTTEGFLHRVFGSETFTRTNPNVRRLSTSQNTYYPPTRRKVYDNTLPFLNDYSNNPLEFTGYVILSWEDYAAAEDEYGTF